MLVMATTEINKAGHVSSRSLAKSSMGGDGKPGADQYANGQKSRRSNTMHRHQSSQMTKMNLAKEDFDKQGNNT